MDTDGGLQIQLVSVSWCTVSKISIITKRAHTTNSPLQSILVWQSFQELNVMYCAFLMGGLDG